MGEGKRSQKNIRILGIFVIILAVALLLNLTYLQVVGQRGLEENNANTRRLIKEYGIARGKIVTADGLVAAESEKTDGFFGYLRSYPQGSLLSQIIG